MIQRAFYSLLTLFALLSLAPAAEITWVSFHDSAEPSGAAAGAGYTQAPDIGYTDLLEANGHTVTRRLTMDDPTAADLAVMNGSDLVIISRSVNSGHYQQETAFWNTQVTAPVMMLSGYILRDSRLNFTDGGTMVDTNGPVKLVAEDAGHPIFSGVGLDGAGVMINDFSNVQTQNGVLQRGASVNTNNPVGGTLIASISAGGNPANGPVIVEWMAGATLNNGDLLAGQRLAFLSGSREADGVTSETAGIYDLSPQGAQMFLNAVRYLARDIEAGAPIITALLPATGSDFHPAGDGVTFTVEAGNGVAQGDVRMVLNGADVSGQLTFAGAPTNLQVTFPMLEVNRIYSGEITATNGAGMARVLLDFNTFEEDAFSVEMEDFNFDGGEFIDDPALNFGATSYVDKGAELGVWGVDFVENNPEVRPGGGALEYRIPVSDEARLPQTIENGVSPRAAYEAAGFPEYDVVMVSSGEWLNFTRNYPAGDSNVAARLKRADGDTFVARLDEVTSDPTTGGQTTETLGFFLGDTVGNSHDFVFLTDVTGVPVTINPGGLATLRVTALEGTYDANYFLLAPASTATQLPGITISSPVDASAAAPGSDLVVAVAVDNPGNVTSVAYRAETEGGGTVTIGENSVAPFGITWPAVAEGAYDIIARVTSTDGLVNDSPAVRVYFDATAPQLESVNGLPSRTEVQVRFNEPLDPTTGGNAGSYSIAAGGGANLPISGVSLSADGRTATLTTAAQTIGELYTLTFNGLTDRAGISVGAGTEGEFRGVGPILQGEDGFIVFEAEAFDRNLDGLWVRNETQGNPSGGASMVVLNGSGGSENSTVMEYDVIFAKTGTHYVWWRASADSSGTDDSAWLHLDGARPVNRETGNEASMSGFNGQPFVWRNVPQEGGGTMTIEIDTAGLHTIGIARREDGALIDKMVVSTSATFNPLDFGEFGPEPTRREGEPEVVVGEARITLDPEDVSGLERTSVTLMAGFEADPGVLFTPSWERKNVGEADFTVIAGEGGETLTIDPLTLDWDGAEVRLRLTTAAASIVSATATVSVTAETEAPFITRVTGLALTNRVTVRFSEPVDPTIAGNAGAYSIEAEGGGGNVAVQTVTVLPGASGVILETGAQVVGTKYTVTASGIPDTAATPNIAAETQGKFFSLGALLPQGADGLMVFEAENFNENLDGLWIEDSNEGTPSGGVAMVVPNGTAGTSEDGTVLEYNLEFTQTGTHTVWYRAYAPGGGTDDSGWLHIDGVRPVGRETGNLASMSGFDGPPDFVWRSQAQDGGGRMTFDLTDAGPHVFGLSVREDGSYFDKFIVTTDPGFNPDNFGEYGPGETREGAPALPGIEITSPLDGETVLLGTDVAIGVDVEAPGRVVSRVEFFNGAEKIGESASEPFAFTWTGAPVGAHNLRVVVTDDVGDSVSMAVAITVQPEGGDPILVDIFSDGTDLTLMWVGGIAPYTVQRTLDFVSGAWVDVLSTDELEATFAIEPGHAFYRVIGTIPPQ